VLGIPASIDNDVPCTDACIGFDTAVNTIVECVQKVGDTAASHHRVMVLETMGRGSGQLAQTAALAAGAEIVVTPERPPLDKAKKLGIAQRLESSLTQGRRHAIVLMAEGVQVEGGGPEGPAQSLAGFLQGYFKRGECPLASVEVRLTVLGHIQRGGSPSAADRILAARYGEAAWQAVMSPRVPSGALGLSGRTIVLHPFESSPDSQGAAHVQKMYDLQKDVSKY
jgi:6-phosphofructokinase